MPPLSQAEPQAVTGCHRGVVSLRPGCGVWQPHCGKVGSACLQPHWSAAICCANEAEDIDTLHILRTGIHHICIFIYISFLDWAFNHRFCIFCKLYIYIYIFIYIHIYSHINRGMCIFCIFLSCFTFFTKVGVVQIFLRMANRTPVTHIKHRVVGWRRCDRSFVKQDQWCQAADT